MEVAGCGSIVSFKKPRSPHTSSKSWSERLQLSASALIALLLMFYCRSDSLWIMKIVSTACLTIITAIFYLSSCKATLTSIFSFSGRVLLSPPRMSPLLRCATGSAQRGKREASRPEVVKEKATKRITRIRKMQMKKSVPNKPDGDMINISTIDVPELLDHWMRQLRSHLDPSSFTGKDVNNSRNMSSIALTTYRNVFNTLGDERVARVVLRCILSPPEIDRKEDIKSEAFVAQVHHLASMFYLTLYSPHNCDVCFKVTLHKIWLKPQELRRMTLHDMLGLMMNSKKLENPFS